MRALNGDGTQWWFVVVGGLRWKPVVWEPIWPSLKKVRYNSGEAGSYESDWTGEKIRLAVQMPTDPVE